MNGDIIIQKKWMIQSIHHARLLIKPCELVLLVVTGQLGRSGDPGAWAGVSREGHPSQEMCTENIEGIPYALRCTWTARPVGGASPEAHV